MPCAVRDVGALLVALATGVALAVSIVRKGAGVAGQRERVERRSARVAAMTGIDRDEQRFDETAPEFPPVLDLVARRRRPGRAGGGRRRCRVAGVALGGPHGRRRRCSWGPSATPCCSATGTWCSPAWPGAPCSSWCGPPPWCGRPRWSLLLVPTGMVSVLDGSIDDGYGGILGWIWITCAVTTLGPAGGDPGRPQGAPVLAPSWPPPGCSTWPSSPAFGTDLVARALLA